MKNIKILGAGISGLTAAINLAKAGYKVTVYEKNKDVGMRFHGDLEGLENWSEKEDIIRQLEEMNLKINFDCDPFNEIIVTDCEKKSKISFKKPLFYLVKRGSFRNSLDYGLKKQALDAGVEILFNKTILPEKANIVATGPILKEIGVIDKGLVFKTNSKNSAVLAFNEDLAFEGYSYLLITKGYGCICAVVLNELNKINECFKKTKEFFIKKYNLKIRSGKNAGGIGSFALKHVLEVKHKKNETLYVGEAAGFQDFLWGFGMRYAFESGYLAAYSLINNEDYEKLARKKFEHKLKASMVNRYLWEKLGNKAYSSIVKYPYLAKKCLYSMHNYNLIQKMLYPFALKYLQEKYPKLKI